MALGTKYRKSTKDADFKFGVARAHIMQKAPYFGNVLYSLYPVEVDKIRRMVRRPDGMYVQEMDTFGVTNKGILLYTEKALEKFTGDGLVFVLAHEVLHVLLTHGDRCIAGGFDPELYNIAADIFINDQLRAGNWRNPPETICWPETWGFKPGLAADEYYYLLREKQAEQQEKKDQRDQEGQCGQCGQPPHEDEDGEPQKCDEHGEGEGEPQKGDDPGEGDGEPQEGEGQPQGSGCPNGKPGEIDGEPDLTNMGQTLKEDTFGHCGSAGGNTLENEADLTDEARKAERSPAEMETIRTQAAQEMASHAQKNPGSIPLGLERWVKGILGPPKVNWREKLRRVARRCHEWAIGQDDYKYGRMHRRQAGFGWGPKSIVMPTMITPIPSVLVAVDTSGSMGEEELTIGLRELDGVLKSLKTKVTICSCDAQVHELKPVQNWREAAKALVGGGGTSFIPIFDAVAKMRDKPDLVVVVTDGWGPAPEKAPRGYKTIWLEVGSDATSPCKWGDHIRLNT